MDIVRSVAEFTGAPLDAKDAPDSENVLPALLGESARGRETLVEQGPSLSLRAGKWKYIPPSPGARLNKNVNIELGADPRPQLYDLATDIGEARNLAEQYPERVAEMDAILRKIR